MSGEPAMRGFKALPPAMYKIADFTEDDDNVNAHSDIDLNATIKSMEQFGQIETLVVDLRTKKVIGGNGRFRKMKERGWKEFCAYGVVEGTDDQIKTLAITLNKTGRLSDFDYTKLSLQLQDLQHSEDPGLLSLTGFQQHELEPLLSAEMHLPDVTVPEEKEKKENTIKVDMNLRGVTLQFNTEQKPNIDAALNKFRGEVGDFSIAPAEVINRICKQYVDNETEQTE